MKKILLPLTLLAFAAACGDSALTNPTATVGPEVPKPTFDDIANSDLECWYLFAPHKRNFLSHRKDQCFCPTPVLHRHAQPKRVANRMLWCSNLTNPSTLDGRRSPPHVVLLHDAVTFREFDPRK